MEVKIVKKPSFDIIEKVEIHTTENGQNVKSIPDFWDRANTDGTVDTLIKLADDPAYVYGICYENTNGNEKNFAYSIAVESTVKTLPVGFCKNTVPARTWAVFPCVGAMPHAIQDLWKRIYTEFFPNSEYKSLREVEIEVYPDGDTDSSDYYCEIWIPVVKK